jgi:hypothetical protein
VNGLDVDLRDGDAAVPVEEQAGAELAFVRTAETGAGRRQRGDADERRALRERGSVRMSGEPVQTT